MPITLTPSQRETLIQPIRDFGLPFLDAAALLDIYPEDATTLLKEDRELATMIARARAQLHLATLRKLDACTSLDKNERPDFRPVRFLLESAFPETYCRKPRAKAEPPKKKDAADHLADFHARRDAIFAGDPTYPIFKAQVARHEATEAAKVAAQKEAAALAAEAAAPKSADAPATASVRTPSPINELIPKPISRPPHASAPFALGTAHTTNPPPQRPPNGTTPALPPESS